MNRNLPVQGPNVYVLTHATSNCTKTNIPTGLRMPSSLMLIFSNLPRSTFVKVLDSPIQVHVHGHYTVEREFKAIYRH